MEVYRRSGVGGVHSLDELFDELFEVDCNVEVAFSRIGDVLCSWDFVEEVLLVYRRRNCIFVSFVDLRNVAPSSGT
jgi:hypothetical protein